MQAEADVARDRAAQTSFPMRSNNPVEAERAEYGAPNSSTVTLSMSDGEMGGNGGGDALVGEGGGLGEADGGGCMETIRIRLLAPSVTTRDRLSGPKQSICKQETPQILESRLFHLASTWLLISPLSLPLVSLALGLAASCPSDREEPTCGRYQDLPAAQRSENLPVAG